MSFVELRHHGPRRSAVAHLWLATPLGSAFHTVAVLSKLVLGHETVVRGAGHVLAVDAGKEGKEVGLVVAHVLGGDAAGVVRVIGLYVSKVLEQGNKWAGGSDMNDARGRPGSEEAHQPGWL